MSTSVVVLVSWHAHYVVNIELVCSTLHHVPMFLCLIFSCVCFFFTFLLLLPAFWWIKVNINQTFESKSQIANHFLKSQICNAHKWEIILIIPCCMSPASTTCLNCCSVSLLSGAPPQLTWRMLERSYWETRGLLAMWIITGGTKHTCVTCNQ